MGYRKTGLSAIAKSYRNTWQLLIKTPAILFPFFIFVGIELLGLLLLFLAPRMPLKLVLGPAIKTFWGEGFLHYPTNFILLPKLASLNRMVLAVFIGSLLTGMAVAIVFDLFNKKTLKLKTAFQAALKQYVSLFIIVLIFTLLFYFSVKFISIGLTKYFMAGHSRLLFLKAGLWMGPILFVINFLLAVFIQAVFIYAIPILMIEKAKLIKAFTGSFALFGRLLIPTLILVGLPMLVYIPIIVLEGNVPFLINKVFPEFVLLVLILSTLISSLVIDFLVTVSTTFLYLSAREI